jgi:hypothetical protein
MLLFAALIAGCTQATANPLPEPPAPAAPAAPQTQQEPATPTTPATTPEPVKATTPAEDVNAAKLVKVADILNNPKTYSGKKVIVEGKIVSECGSGCWFTLKDGNAVIYIDLAPNNMVIPQKKGSFARVNAVVEYVGSDVYLIGSKVEF